MADIDFPADLPKPLGGSFAEGELQSWVEDRGEVGAPGRRNRFTRSLETFEFTLRLTNDQKQTLKAFYEDDLARGVKAFNWTHPTSGEVYAVQFVSKPRPSHVSGSVDMWDAEIRLQEI